MAPTCLSRPHEGSSSHGLCGVFACGHYSVFFCFDSKVDFRRDARKRRAAFIGCELRSRPQRWADARIQKNAFSHIIARLRASKALSPYPAVALYNASPGEVDCRWLAARLSQQGVRCFGPNIEPSTKILSWAPMFPAELNMHESCCARPFFSVVVVPGLAFSRLGDRLGQGGGYYDATLAALRSLSSPYLMGLSYRCQLYPAECFSALREAHDVLLDFVLTECDSRHYGQAD